MFETNENIQTPNKSINSNLTRLGTSTPPISKYFSEIFSPGHIKLLIITQIRTLNRSTDRRKSRNLNKIVKYFRVEK